MSPEKHMLTVLERKQENSVAVFAVTEELIC